MKNFYKFRKIRFVSTAERNILFANKQDQN